MKDWDKLEPDVTKLLTKHFTKHAAGREVDFVVVHYNAGNLTVEGCYSVWQTREASAHYQVEDGGRTGQLVYDRDIAWHAGDWDANCRSIGIEHANRSDGTISDACLDAGAHLVAAICKKYGLGAPTWGVNVFPHKHFKATSCPGELYGSQRDAYINKAREWYAAMTGTSAEPVAPSAPSLDLGDKSWWGPKFTCEMQTQFGTEVDGIVSRQPNSNKKYLSRADASSWKFGRTLKTAGGYCGSMMVQRLQAKVGATVDGWMGKESVKALQKWLIARGYSVGSCGADGSMGPDTCRAVGAALEAGAFRG